MLEVGGEIDYELEAMKTFSLEQREFYVLWKKNRRLPEANWEEDRTPREKCFSNERRTAAGARTRATHPIREQRHRHGEHGLLDPDTPLPYTTPKSRRQGPPQRVEREDTGGPV